MTTDRWPASKDLRIQPYDIVRDVVSGWVGMATCEYRYANGCLRYEVGGANKDGQPEAYVLDEEQLVVIERAVSAVQPKRAGGDRSSTPVARP